MSAEVTGFRASRRIWMISKSRDALRISAAPPRVPSSQLTIPCQLAPCIEAVPCLKSSEKRATDMTYAENLWLFFILLFGIIIVPGMDMLFVLTNALTRGRPAGLSATAGIMTGGAGHALIGALGVG